MCTATFSDWFHISVEFDGMLKRGNFDGVFFLLSMDAPLEFHLCNHV